MTKKWIITISFTIVVFIILAICLKKYNSFIGVPKEYINIKYAIKKNEYCSCITFLNRSKFSEYDCDSEPTNMPYSGEYYDRYTYKSKENIIIFKGHNMEPIAAEIISWDENKLVLKVKGSKQDTYCSSNGKDIYEYYAES